jgi:hypothetical protein
MYCFVNLHPIPRVQLDLLDPRALLVLLALLDHLGREGKR